MEWDTIEGESGAKEGREETKDLREGAREWRVEGGGSERGKSVRRRTVERESGVGSWREGIGHGSQGQLR